METATFVVLAMVEVFFAIFIINVITGAEKTANAKGWEKRIIFFAKLVIVLFVLTSILVSGSILTKEASQRASDNTTIEHFLSGKEIDLPSINGVIGPALHPQIKIWAAKHFPPEKREEAYKAMLDQIFKTKVKLEMPAAIAPYFTPTSDPTADTPETTPPSE